LSSALALRALFRHWRSVPGPVPRARAFVQTGKQIALDQVLLGRMQRFFDFRVGRPQLRASRLWPLALGVRGTTPVYYSVQTDFEPTFRLPRRAHGRRSGQNKSRPISRPFVYRLPRTSTPRTSTPRTSTPRTLQPRTSTPRTLQPRTSISQAVIQRTVIQPNRVAVRLFWGVARDRRRVCLVEPLPGGLTRVRLQSPDRPERSYPQPAAQTIRKQDGRLTLCFDKLAAGIYTLAYTARAQHQGRFLHPPACLVDWRRKPLACGNRTRIQIQKK
jgi:hypothetical protein